MTSPDAIYVYRPLTRKIMRLIGMALGSAMAVLFCAKAAAAQDQGSTDPDAGAPAPTTPTPTPTPTTEAPSDPTPPSEPAVAPPPPTSETKNTLAYPAAERKNAIQADLGLAVVGLAYERMLLPRIALQLEAQIFGTWFGPMFDLPNFSGVGAQVRPTWFVTGDEHAGPRGVYL